MANAWQETWQKVGLQHANAQNSQLLLVLRQLLAQTVSMDKQTPPRKSWLSRRMSLALAHYYADPARNKTAAAKAGDVSRYGLIKAIKRIESEQGAQDGSQA